MKYALIGCGMISAAHLKAARETGLEIAALCDLNEENARKALAQLPEEESSSTAVYTDYRRMLDEVRPELVALALGSGVKRAIACDCLAAGANVIVEKPMAMTVEDCEAMVEAARKNGKYLMVAQNQRFNTGHLRAKELITAGALVPDAVVEGMIESAFDTLKGFDGFLLDGFRLYRFILFLFFCPCRTAYEQHTCQQN